MVLYDWYHVKSLYSDDECDKLLEISQKHHSDLLKDRGAADKNVSTSVVEMHYYGSSLDKMFRMVHDINRNYYGYNLFQERPLGMNVNRYSGSTNEYPYHKDCNTPGTSCDSKLTAIMNISKEPYEGGDFFLYFGYDKHLPEVHERGSLLVFPSHTYHKVSPVVNGERITLSTWLQGPNFV
jgi:PKHD-type hydroxylase